MARNWDNTDVDILYVLRRDATRSAGEVAEEVGVDEAEAQERIEALESEGVIERYFAVVDPWAAGYPHITYTYLQSYGEYTDTLEQYSAMSDAAKWGTTQSVCVVYGEHDFIIRSLHPDQNDIYNFKRDAFSPDSQFRQLTLTEVVRAWGIDFDGTDRGETDGYTFSDVEKKILQKLQEDARLANEHEDLATAINEDLRKVKPALRRLESNNVIRGYSVNLDTQQLGWYRAFTDLVTEKGKDEEIISALREENAKIGKNHLYIPYVFRTDGTWANFLVEMFIESLDHLDRITDEIRARDAVRDSETYIAAKTIHDNVETEL